VDSGFRSNATKRQQSPYEIEPAVSRGQDQGCQIPRSACFYKLVAYTLLESLLLFSVNHINRYEKDISRKSSSRVC
jgi:hypothetical protein